MFDGPEKTSNQVGQTLRVRDLTYLERIDEQEVVLVQRLEKTRRIKKLLDENPAIQELLTLIREVGI